MQGGFKECPLKVNVGLGSLEQWDESAINRRAGKLAKQALGVWPAPELAVDILNTYRPKTIIKDSYSIKDHPHLLSAPMKELFGTFRKEVIALDRCVSEEFLKLYVAYKAETNFVDIVPQAKQFRISLNMRYTEISDPRGICKDVSGFGRWGMGM